MSQLPIAPFPSISSHGGLVIGNNDNTYIEAGGKKPILLHPAMHICADSDHGVSFVVATGFTTVNGSKVVRTFDICGCGAYIISKADNTASEN